MKQRIDQLKADYKYKQIRELIEKKEDKNGDDKRSLAEAYYKDLELHKESSYPKAIKLLEDIDLNNDNNPSETLCLLGAICKRKWEYEKNLDFLYKSISFYTKAYTEYKNDEWYYGAVNSSFLYDVLADEFKDKDPEYSKSLRKKAVNIRKDIIKEFDREKNNSNLWVQHTLAQAYLGINDIEKCKEKLKEANRIKSDDWENHTSYKQLKTLADLKDIKDLSFLEEFIPNSEYITFDKKGLALSGGGFRASFFHLGTLAKLAECDILKDIEVISTVSGGSIVGVLYYLKLQKLLESKYDEQITQKDYINLVDELIYEFYEGVQSDIRNSVISEKFISSTILKVLNPFSSYSRTNKLGKIYQKRFYNKYKKYMNELIITPKDHKNKKEGFRPRFNNWNRKNKVPILVINATNLNSGHTWQFQATKMGEPDYMNDQEIDKNNRFDWVRYSSKGLLKSFKNYPIGQAVACSSAVPVLFTPIVLKDLYEGYKLSISDGGVYDNQGFSGLLSEECDYIICSDASGQMDNQITSHTTIVRTNMRTVDIQMDRNRELAYEDIQKMYKSKILKGFLFTHLKAGIDPKEIKQEQIIPKVENKKFQNLISNIRTDLDSFSKIEAYALMYNGYTLFKKQVGDAGCKKYDWVFLKNGIDYESDQNIQSELELGKYKFGRRFRKWWGSR